MNIPFNKPYLTGNEIHNIDKAVLSGHLSGNGDFTKMCQDFFEKKYGFTKALLTTSCTDALEMAAILADIHPGDEIIVPSFTFVSTANAFVLRGAKIVFVDSREDHPGIDEDKIEELITSKTKAIVPVHYAGVACDMDKIMDLALKYDILVIEDAAQAIDSYYTGRDGIKRPLGSIGHFAAFSFHETKNIISGEGGMLVVNEEKFVDRAEIIWEKGTNRSAFFRGEVDKYGWKDIGSSFLPSEITAAFLFAQLEKLEEIQVMRSELWHSYLSAFNNADLMELVKTPTIPNYATNNAHMFYVLCNNLKQREKIIKVLRNNNIHSVFHYLSLHKSEYIKQQVNLTSQMPMSDLYTDKLLRMPFYNELDIEVPLKIVSILKETK